MTDDVPDRPSDQMADADVANGESGVLDEGFEEQQGQRPPTPDRAHATDGDADDADDADDAHETDHIDETDGDGP